MAESVTFLVVLMYLILLQREEDKSSLPICIKNKLFLMTVSDNILKTDSALYTRAPFSAEIPPRDL